MSTAPPPPSPPEPPKYIPKDPPIPSKSTVHGPYSAKNCSSSGTITGVECSILYTECSTAEQRIGLRFSSPRKTLFGCGTRACELAVRISSAGTRSMQQWCLQSCVLP